MCNSILTFIDKIMGFFDLIGDLACVVAKSAFEEFSDNFYDEKPRLSQSAISRGRMRKAKSIDDLPETPAIYRHVDNTTGEIVYTGVTNNLRRRQKEHRRSGNINNMDIYYSKAKPNSTLEDLYITEKAHIKRHKPSKNKHKGGNGRRAAS